MKNSLNLLLGFLGWFAVISQFVLMVENRTTTIAEMTIRFFSFYTILTNLLVSLFFTRQIFIKEKRSYSSGLLDQPGMLTAITVYITVVGLVYQVALRNIWQPEGLQLLVDELLHSVIPVLVIIYWLMYEKGAALKWKKIPANLLYPLLYLIFILFRGGFSGFYPYPFINVIELGWSQTLVNIALLVGVFLAISLLFYSVGRIIRRRSN